LSLKSSFCGFSIIFLSVWASFSSAKWNQWPTVTNRDIGGQSHPSKAMGESASLFFYYLVLDFNVYYLVNFYTQMLPVLGLESGLIYDIIYDIPIHPRKFGHQLIFCIVWTWRYCISMKNAFLIQNMCISSFF
jgi:hypothetical protein